MTSAAAPSQSLRVVRELRRRFGHVRLRPGQQAVIDRVLHGANTLAVMPTGAGKSLCYQLPACLLPGLTIVVSPLIALITDQQAKLERLGVTAVQLHSGRSAEALKVDAQALAAGRAKIAFVTPERLGEPGFIDLLGGQPVSLLVVDEAHCISRWGEDFRPAYSEIGAALEAIGAAPVLALTATATDDVATDIAEQLNIPPDGLLLAGSYRPNLQLAVEVFADEAAKQARAVAALASADGPAIAYAATIKSAESLHQALQQAGLRPLLYHGRLPASERREAQRQFFEAREPAVMVATNAFGLGIDKPNIRLVLHVQMPPGLDSYYQEAGRAGRDGAPALCLLLFRSADRAVQQFFINGRYPSAADGREMWRLFTEAQAPPNGWTLEELKSRLQRPLGKLRVLVNWLRRNGWVEVDAEGTISLREPHDADELDRLLQRFMDRSQRDQERLECMAFYGQTGGCRWRVLLQGLGETARFDRCGHCDNCRRIALQQRRLVEAAEEDDTQARSPEPARFAAGQLVRIRRYGQGTVIEASAESVTIEFADGQQRCFDPAFVRPIRPLQQRADRKSTAAALRPT